MLGVREFDLRSCNLAKLDPEDTQVPLVLTPDGPLGLVLS